MLQPARIGFCCTFVSPAGDSDEERRLNMRRITLASLARKPPAEAFDALAAVVAHNLDALDAQLGLMVVRPASQPPLRLPRRENI